ncbi:MAG: helix-turn-helix domain-containing protein, partial [Anaerolineae bacterium]
HAIRAAREMRGLTQETLAARIDVSQSTISFWENGIETPTLEHQVRLITEMPEILNAMAAQELNLLERVQRLERAVFSGKCGCAGCTCDEDTPVKSLREA